jgi:hypothetical protein
MTSPQPVSGNTCMTVSRQMTKIQGIALRMVAEERIKSKPELQISALMPVGGHH